MKIVHLISYFSIKSRYQEYYLATEQIRTGNEVYVLTSDRIFPFEDYKNTSQNVYGDRELSVGMSCEEGINIIRLPVLFEVRRRVWMIGLREKLAEIEPDMIIAHGIFNTNSARLLCFGNIRGKIIFDDHMTFAQVDQSFTGIVSYYFFRRMFAKKLLRKAYKIIAISDACIRTIHGCYGVPLDRIDMIPLGADIETFKFNPELRYAVRNKLEINSETIVIGFTGKVYYERRLDVLIKAMNNYRGSLDLHLLVVGSIVSSYKVRFDELLSSLRHRYSIIPMVETKELVGFMCASDILVYSHPTISTIEASSCSRAVICTNQLPERYKNGNGIPIEPGDQESMENALFRLVDDENLRNDMGQRGREYAEKELSWKIINEKILS